MPSHCFKRALQHAQRMYVPHYCTCRQLMPVAVAFFFTVCSSPHRVHRVHRVLRWSFWSLSRRHSATPMRLKCKSLVFICWPKLLRLPPHRYNDTLQRCALCASSRLSFKIVFIKQFFATLKDNHWRSCALVACSLAIRYAAWL